MIHMDESLGAGALPSKRRFPSLAETVFNLLKNGVSKGFAVCDGDGDDDSKTSVVRCHTTV